MAGRYPYVRLIHSTAEIYPAAPDFVSRIEREVEARRKESEERRQRYQSSTNHNLTAAKSIDVFRRDPRYAGDGNRIDLAYAVYALSHGVSEDDVRRALGTRDLSKKGTSDRQADYVERTVEKALRTVGAECRER